MKDEATGIQLGSQITQKITMRHRRIMDALIRDGLTPREVSIEFGITESRLAILRKSPLWKAEEAEMRKQHVDSYRGKLASLLPKSIQALDDVVVEKREVEFVNADGELDTKVIFNTPKDRLAAAKEILSRSGIVEGFELNVNDTGETDAKALYEKLEEIAVRKKALRASLGILDAEVVDGGVG